MSYEDEIEEPVWPVAVLIGFVVGGVVLGVLRMVGVL